VSGLGAIGRYAIGAFPDDDPDTLLFTAATRSAAFLVWLLELDAYQLSTGVSVPISYGIGSRAIGVLSLSGETPGGTVVLRASDVGYISRPSDPEGVMLYPPYVATPLIARRELPLSPEAGTRVGASWGDVVLLNPRVASGVGYWDSIVAGYAIDGRRVRILLGEREWDADRQIWLDPPYSRFRPVFTGVAIGWFNEGEIVRVALRDSLYPAEVALDTGFYTGAGGLDGSADIAGKPKPKTRGQVQNISPVLVDPAYWLYQFNDGAGLVDAVYERGLAGYTSGGDVATGAALLAAVGAAGSYKTCLAEGLIRLYPAGTSPAGAMTCDVRGSFPDGSYRDRAALLVAHLLLQDALVPEASLDMGSFTALDALLPSVSGLYLPDPTTAVEAADQLARGLGAVIGTDRSGRAAIYRLSPRVGNPLVTLTTSEIVAVTARRLPETIVQPNWRRTVAYARNYTVQTSDLPATVEANHRAFIATEYRLAAWADAALRTAYLRAIDGPVVPTLLYNSADAEALAEHLGSLWGAPRSCYDVELKYQSLALDLTQPLLIDYPMADLTGGRMCVAVGEAIDAAADRTTLTVLTVDSAS
jgi:hypothetical protein